MKKNILMTFLCLLLAGCASKQPATTSDEEVFEVNPETHARDAEIMSKKAPTTLASSSSFNEKALEIQQFSTINYAAIGRDLRSGQGKHLKELLRILNIPSAKHGSSVQVLKVLYKKSPGPTKFSQNLWTWYQRKK